MQGLLVTTRDINDNDIGPILHHYYRKLVIVDSLFQARYLSIISPTFPPVLYGIAIRESLLLSDRTVCLFIFIVRLFFITFLI